MGVVVRELRAPGAGFDRVHLRRAFGSLMCLQPLRLALQSLLVAVVGRGCVRCRGRLGLNWGLDRGRRGVVFGLVLGRRDAARDCTDEQAVGLSSFFCKLSIQDALALPQRPL